MPSLDLQEISFCPDQNNYQHMKLEVTGQKAEIIININPDKSLFEKTQLKLNSYDLGVDIELAHIITRLRFEYPNTRVVIIKSGQDKIFSAGANIYMLKKASHKFKVNFCKYTNETRLHIEEASKYSDLKFLCAINGIAAGGGYELALACDKILLIDDKNASVSLPEVPLLGVLPGTGGLTRVVDKRKVRKDIADIFCTISEGAKGKKALSWGLVDSIYSKSNWEAGIKQEASSFLTTNYDPKQGIKLKNIEFKKNNNNINYKYVKLSLVNNKQANLKILGPTQAQPTNFEAMREMGSDLWLLQAFRELDDAILKLRFLYPQVGLVKFETQGDKNLVLEAESSLYNSLDKNSNWFVRELSLLISRVFRRIDTTSKSFFATVTPESCFCGVLAELLFTCDRTYGLLDSQNLSQVILTKINKNILLNWTGVSRIEHRFCKQENLIKQAYEVCTGNSMNIMQAHKLGLITQVFDDIDFEDEVRLFCEERLSLSPDALTAMESNLRFNGPENLATKIFGRLSAWQNWVFIRENATGPTGALMSYGEQTRAKFNFDRC